MKTKGFANLKLSISNQTQLSGKEMIKTPLQSFLFPKQQLQYFLPFHIQNPNPMNYQLQNEQVQNLLEESNEENIYFHNFQFHRCLETLPPKQLQRDQSIRIMMGLINAILYLKTNKLNPCQIKFTYVGCDKNNNWGLKHVICYRTRDPPKDPDAYDNTEFLYHINQDNELVWNLGKIWLRFYNDKKITVIDTAQVFLNQLIDKSVTDQKINKVLRKMLSVKKQNRISFQKFIQDEVFSIQNSQQHLYSSICLHFQMVSNNEKVKSSLNYKRQIQNPYQDQIFRRDMQQALDICFLLQKCIFQIRSLYEKNIEIELSIYVIKAEAYCLLKKLDEKKIYNQIVDYTVTHKKAYSKFVTKMLTLKQELQRKRKMKIFSEKNALNEDQKKFLMPTDEMTFPKIHHIFKSILVNFYMDSEKQLKQIQSKDMSKKAKDEALCVQQKKCLVFLLARLCNTIFSQLRTFIFYEFVKRPENKQKGLRIRQFLDFIDNCNDAVSLKLIRSKVCKNGFQGLNSNKRIQQIKK